MAFTGYPVEYVYEPDVNGDVTVTDTVPERVPADAYVATFAGVPYNVIVGSDGDDDLEGFGTFGDDTAGFNNEDLILGFGGNDKLRGLNGNDVLIGGDGNDKLYGDNGDDDLLGLAGNDTLYPGIDDDLSDGGDDSDLVVLAAPEVATNSCWPAATAASP